MSGSDTAALLGEALVALADEDGTIYTVDVILWNGRKWLVADWLDSPAEKWTTPARAICLEGLRYQDDENSSPRFVLNDPIPRSVIEGRALPAEAVAYVVVDRPDIRLPIMTLH